MRYSAAAAVAIAARALAQEGNASAPFPHIVYPDGLSPNPLTIEGARSNQTSPPAYPSPWASGQGDWAAAYERAVAIVSQLTLTEKVNLTTGTGWTQDQCVGNTGSVPRLGIRGFCYQDSPTGLRFTDFNSAFPAGVNVGATWDRELAYLRAVAMGEEFRDKGVDGALAPVAGPMGRAPEGGRNWEGFSPDPYLTGELFAQSVKGIQSTGSMAVGKHYIGNEQEHFRVAAESIGFGHGIIEYAGSANIDDTTLHELYLWPFANAVRAGMVAVMCAYNRVNNSDACQNSYLMNHVLKGELGFQGYVLSDWQAQHSGVSSTLAGMDVSMPGDILFDSWTSYNGANLTIAVLNGTVPQWRLDDMVVRLLSSWFFVGGDKTQKDINFNSWTSDTYGAVHAFAGPKYGYGLVNQHVDVRRNHRDIIRRIGAASTILLKNVNNALPLTGKEKLTAVFGEDAFGNPWGPNGCPDRGCYQGTNAMGWGSGTANFPYLITPDTAIQSIVTSYDSAYESISHNGALTQIQNLARRVANVGGACIAFGGADSGEAYLTPDYNYGDRNNLTFWQGAEAVFANVTGNCNNTILVIHSPGQIAIDHWKNHPNVTAILWAGLPGEQTGWALTDVLYGKVNPSGKLPYTIGKKRSDYGTDLLYKSNGPVPQLDFDEGVFVDYRHFDHANVEPTYEFGFGLSYTTFSYSNLNIIKRSTGAYSPTTGHTKAAPSYGTIEKDTSAHQYPSKHSFTRVPNYIYPWLNNTDLKKAYGYTDYGDDSFIPKGARDGSPQPLHPAGGAPGGNPALWDVLYHVTVTVTNTGHMAGEEVAQLYLSLGGKYDPKRVLRGFEKVSLQPGQSLEVGFDLCRRDVSNWDTVSQNWVITEAPKMIYVGASSRNLPLSAKLG